jgi:hypothetical protein
MIKILIKDKMTRMTDDFSRITIRLKTHEQAAFRLLINEIRKRAGYEVPATEVVKSLMGFRTKLSDLSDSDRSILKQHEKKFNRA